MSVTPSSTVVGVFRNRSQAEQAIEGLYGAGFAHEQIRFSAPGTTGSFFQDLKSLFTGNDTTSSTIARDLNGLGFSDDDALYYASEYSNGNTLLTVQSPGREEEVLGILHRYGAYNVRPSTSFADDNTGNDGQPAADDTQASDYPVGEQDMGTIAYQQPATSYAEPGKEEGFYQQPEESQDVNANAEDSNYSRPVESAADETPIGDYVPKVDNYDAEPEEQASEQNVDEGIVEREAEEDSYQQPEASTAEQQPQAPDVPEQDAASAEYKIEDGQYDSTEAYTSRYNTEPDLSQVEAPADENPEAQGATAPATWGGETPAQEAATEGTTSAQGAGYEDASVGAALANQNGAYQVSQNDDVTATHAAQLQRYQQQLQATQQQLQEAKSRLQRAKDHEQQLQSVKQQLAELEQELQATLAELNDTHSRINEYQ
ncbi:hypothetical protein [Ktedonobacter robiniae]|uniref:Uncharacterized protein n=1 Tax=Ktedonobacter robiniae TaxID=2778365 RepID=A0ABQ3UK81_9CHLR|nr:hypothetical protein [Ktedonobacter robiniae]GHO53073.1 hypothetical protein KSB_15480 [Ktedonobacter robiniae]